MTTPASAGLRYRIILRSDCRQLLAGIPGEFSAESHRGWTCVMATVRDESEFYGLLDWFQELALHIVSVNELGSDVGEQHWQPAPAGHGQIQPEAMALPRPPG